MAAGALAVALSFAILLPGPSRYWLARLSALPAQQLRRLRTGA